MTGLCQQHHRLCNTMDMHEDLQVWDDFLDLFNGVSFLQEYLRMEVKLQVILNVAGINGFGVVYFWGYYVGILVFLEFFSILVAIWLWVDEIVNYTVHFWCNDLVLIQVINPLTSKSSRVVNLISNCTGNYNQHKGLTIEAGYRKTPT